MVDKNVGWLVPNQTASSVPPFVHKTTDGGATWSDTILVERGTVVKAVKPVRGTNQSARRWATTATIRKRGGRGTADELGRNRSRPAGGRKRLGPMPHSPAPARLCRRYQKALKFKVSTVTFQVKMNIKMREGGFLPGSGDKVQVNGSFNGWGGKRTCRSGRRQHLHEDRGASARCD